MRAQAARVRAGDDAAMNSANAWASRVPTLLMRPLMMMSSVVLGGVGRSVLGQQPSPLGAVFISNVAPLNVDEVFLAAVPFARASA